MFERFAITMTPTDAPSQVIGLIESDQPAVVLFERTQVCTLREVPQRLAASAESFPSTSDPETILADLEQIKIDLWREFCSIKSRLL